MKTHSVWTNIISIGGAVGTISALVVATITLNTAFNEVKFNQKIITENQKILTETQETINNNIKTLNDTVSFISQSVIKTANITRINTRIINDMSKQLKNIDILKYYDPLIFFRSDDSLKKNWCLNQLK